MVNPAPQTMQVAIQDIDAKATRDAQGLLHRDRVATKRKITLTFGALTVAECSKILDSVKAEFFSVEYLDPVDGQVRSGTFYVGDQIGRAGDRTPEGLMPLVGRRPLEKIKNEMK